MTERDDGLGLTRQERFDFRMSRRFPKMAGRANRLVYQMTGGRVGGSKRGISIGLLTTTVRRSGKLRTVPLMYLDDGARFIVVSSNGGYDTPPAWYVNLLADPLAEFQSRRGSMSVVARALSEDEQTEMWDELSAYNPLCRVSVVHRSPHRCGRVGTSTALGRTVEQRVVSNGRGKQSQSLAATTVEASAHAEGARRERTSDLWAGIISEPVAEVRRRRGRSRQRFINHLCR